MTQAISTLSAVLLAILLWSAYADCPLSFYPRQTTIGNTELMQATSALILIHPPPNKSYPKPTSTL